MNLPDPAPYATPVAQAFAHASAMVNTFGTTTAEATWALRKWQTEYLRMLELGQPKPPLAATPDPWHSSGMLHGKMSKHIHSGDACAAPGPADGESNE